jgi:catechol 2,3-dioxygenase-like lactoylglutathione lyase family enzyme
LAAFSGLGHIAFRVNNLAETLDFYTKLGFPEFLRLDQSAGHPWIVYLKISDELYLELFPGGDGGKAAGPEHTGVHHLCLTTDDIEKTEDHLNSVGIPLTSPLRRDHRGVDGNRGMWITDPNGNRIEIMEMAPDCIQYEALKALREGKGATTLLKPV